MASRIITKKGSGAPLASDLVHGELAVDTVNKRLYTENAGGTIIEVGTSPSTIDINAGTIDGTVIGGSTAAAGSFTTFTSTGIDDNATSTAITIDASENVGIGNPSPDTSLHIGDMGATNATGNGRIKIEDASTSLASTGGLEFVTSSFGSGYGWKVSSIDSSGVHLVFGTRQNSTAWSEKVRLNANGNVGIGTTSFNYGKLELADSGYVPFAVRSTDGVIALLAANSSNEVRMGAVSNHPLSIRTNDTERMRIDSSGNLLVGTTGIPNGTSIYGAAFEASSGDRMELNFGASSASDLYAIRFFNPNGEVGSIRTSGSTTSYNTSSDQRLKDNIVDAPSSSDDIDAIQVRSFDWKADGFHQKYGMIAQELMTVAPEAVSGDPESDEMMGVDYSKLVPMLVKEIQSLRARVAQLETN